MHTVYVYLYIILYTQRVLFPENHKDGDGTELEKQRVAIEHLKQDRLHYREEADKLRYFIVLLIL